MFTEVLPVCAHYLNAICIDFEVVTTEHTHQISNITAYILSLLNSLELLAVKALLVAELLISGTELSKEAIA